MPARVRFGEQKIVRGRSMSREILLPLLGCHSSIADSSSSRFGAHHRRQLRRPEPMAGCIKNGYIGEGYPRLHTAQHESAPTHISASDEFGRKSELFAKDRS